jgi:hypothetical protein
VEDAADETIVASASDWDAPLNSFTSNFVTSNFVSAALKALTI